MELLYTVLAIWMFVYGAIGLAKFLSIKGMVVVLAIVAFFMFTGNFWAVLFIL